MWNGKLAKGLRYLQSVLTWLAPRRTREAQASAFEPRASRPGVGFRNQPRLTAELWKALPSRPANLHGMGRIHSQRDHGKTTGWEGTDALEPVHRSGVSYRAEYMC